MVEHILQLKNVSQVKMDESSDISGVNGYKKLLETTTESVVFINLVSQCLTAVKRVRVI